MLDLVRPHLAVRDDSEALQLPLLHLGDVDGLAARKPRDGALMGALHPIFADA